VRAGGGQIERRCRHRSSCSGSRREVKFTHAPRNRSAPASENPRADAVGDQAGFASVAQRSIRRSSGARPRAVRARARARATRGALSQAVGAQPPTTPPQSSESTISAGRRAANRQRRRRRAGGFLEPVARGRRRAGARNRPGLLFPERRVAPAASPRLRIVVKDFGRSPSSKLDAGHEPEPPSWARFSRSIATVSRTGGPGASLPGAGGIARRATVAGEARVGSAASPAHPPCQGCRARTRRSGRGCSAG
jgi:hypothetical protein